MSYIFVFLWYVYFILILLNLSKYFYLREISFISYKF